MDIAYTYHRKRRDFGRQCHFTERKSDVIVDIQPDPQLRAQYLYRNPVEQSCSAAKEYSEHEVRIARAVLALVLCAYFF